MGKEISDGGMVLNVERQRWKMCQRRLPPLRYHQADKGWPKQVAIHYLRTSVSVLMVFFVSFCEGLLAPIVSIMLTIVLLVNLPIQQTLANGWEGCLWWSLGWTSITGSMNMIMLMRKRHSCWSHSRPVSTDRKRYITGFLMLNSGHVCNIVGACLDARQALACPCF
jgi:hypothetical protein